MNYPWLTTDDILASVKRKISFPSSQSTFSDDDIIQFANEEMFIAQVPSVLEYHQEYFVTYVNFTLLPGQYQYPIPNRAIGMRLRDVFYLDTEGNLYEMTRINPDDKAWFQRDINSFNQPYPYFLENNSISFPPGPFTNPTGSIQLSFFIRPNQLVTNDNAATIQNFISDITINNTGMNIGDTFTINTPAEINGTVATINVFTAVTGVPLANQFLIGATSTITATNLANAINANGCAMASVSGNIMSVTYSLNGSTFQTSNPTSFIIPTNFGIVVDQIPTGISTGVLIDFLQTLPGHRIQEWDIPIANVSGLEIDFNPADVPSTLVVGDYICAANTSIIPYLPPDLHNLLAERTAARILAAIGDLEGLQATNMKIGEMEKQQGRLLDARVDGDPQKITARHSLLKEAKRRTYRRF
jgi:hypothetical protein